MSTFAHSAHDIETAVKCTLRRVHGPRSVPALSGESLWADVAQLARNIVARHREKLLIVELSRHHSRLLVDMGLDPVAIEHAVENSWDEINPGTPLRPRHRERR